MCDLHGEVLQEKYFTEVLAKELPKPRYFEFYVTIQYTQLTLLSSFLINTPFYVSYYDLK
ncbi:hypothetical protein ACVLD2_000666 [Paenibacillus sp. PvR052]|nr:hypothetical protein [Paenibacillus sp. PvP091]MBP1169194.1 hypothetical protein [Paenibacillus sp. PvR098]MBP2440222.1 hypothetical protein [Paenibacillus sp. PvP052]